jgi:hypothetical protein
MATPHVAGAAALLFALEPSLSVVALKALLLDHAEHLQSLEDKVVSEGLLDLSAVVAAVRAIGLIGIDVVTVDDDPALGQSSQRFNCQDQRTPAADQHRCQWRLCAPADFRIARDPVRGGRSTQFLAAPSSIRNPLHRHHPD